MSLYDPQAIVSAARQLRPALDQMDERARSLLPRLDDLLARAEAGEDVDSQILDLLASHPTLRDWLRQALVTGEEVMMTKGPALPGEPDVPATAYECPRCGWIYRLPQKGYPIPHCPVDGSPLRPKEER